MSKKSHFTTVTPIPAGITRETVLDTLHNHTEMIDLNPLVTERHPIKPPKEATPEEFNHCQWYQVTDKVNYLPGGLYTGSVTFNGAFHDLPDGLQTHIYAPMGLDMKGRWTLGGSLPGEPRQPVELGLGVPKTGLWLREDVTMKCNVVMTKFVKNTTKKTHSTLVQRLVEKAHLLENEAHNNALNEQLSLRNTYPPDYHSGMTSPAPPSQPPPGAYPDENPVNSHTISPSLGSHYSGRQQSAGSNNYDGQNNHPYYNPHPHQQPQQQQHQDVKHVYQGYNDPRPAAKTSTPYPGVNPLFHDKANPGQPYLTAELTSQGHAELPSQNQNTPIELESSHRF